jgi:type I restriction enzyme, S subunit
VAAERAREEIDLLREYRTSLIADVVTGKLDVREAAERLPQELAEPEALDELEDMPEDEGVADDEELAAADAA